jgi:hypothetical protein
MLSMWIEKESHVLRGEEALPRGLLFAINVFVALSAHFKGSVINCAFESSN